MARSITGKTAPTSVAPPAISVRQRKTLAGTVAVRKKAPAIGVAAAKKATGKTPAIEMVAPKAAASVKVTAKAGQAARTAVASGPRGPQAQVQVKAARQMPLSKEARSKSVPAGRAPVTKAAVKTAAVSQIPVTKSTAPAAPVAKPPVTKSPEAKAAATSTRKSAATEKNTAPPSRKVAPSRVSTIATKPAGKAKGAINQPAQAAPAKSKASVAGPSRAQKFTVSHLQDSDFKADGLRPYALYRDLGIAAATSGLCQAHVIRFVPPCTDAARQRHIHETDLQLIYVLKGWIKNDFEGHGEQMMSAGTCWLQPSGIRHTVLDYSPDCEVLEVIVPADFRTANVP